MALTYLDWDRGNVLVLSLVGELKLGDGTALLRQLVADAIALGKKKIVLNLGEVQYIDSSGLGELVAAHSRVSQAGGKMKLVNLRARAQELVQSTRLFLLFELYRDEDAAVRSFDTNS